jgi:uncharacterized protein YeeX (DUF496 family)
MECIVNKHIANILLNRDKTISLLEDIINYVEKNKNIMDIHDIAEIIKADNTFMEILKQECLQNNILKEIPHNTVKLTDLFA